MIGISSLRALHISILSILFLAIAGCSDAEKVVDSFELKGLIIGMNKQAALKVLPESKCYESKSYFDAIFDKYDGTHQHALSKTLFYNQMDEICVINNIEKQPDPLTFAGKNAQYSVGFKKSKLVFVSLKVPESTEKISEGLALKYELIDKQELNNPFLPRLAEMLFANGAYDAKGSELSVSSDPENKQHSVIILISSDSVAAMRKTSDEYNVKKSGVNDM